MDGGLSSTSPRTTLSRRDDVTIQQLIGPFFLGIIANYFLWGVQITQSYYYYKYYRKTDRPWLKAAVGLLFITDLVESICASAAAWRFMVDGWGDLNGISMFPGWGLYAIPLTDSFTASIVHFFYAQKIWTLLDSPWNHMYETHGAKIFESSMGLTSSGLHPQLAGGVGASAFLYAINLTFAEFGRIKTWGCIWLVTASVTDIVITTIMALKLAKSRTGFKKTDDIISKLIRLLVETGLATAVVQIVEIILYLCWPQKPYHIVLGCMTPKVYSNSMLALLNSRIPRRIAASARESLQSTSTPFESIQFRNTQTVATTDYYELDNKLASPSTTTRSEGRTEFDATSPNSFDQKGIP